MKARDIMSTPAITIHQDATVGEAARMMMDRQISCLPVIDAEGNLVGILTDSDFGLQRRMLPHGETFYTVLSTWAKPETIELVAEELRDGLVKNVMTRLVLTVEEDTPVAEVVKLMLRRHVHHLPVMRGDKAVGIITRHDLLKLMTLDRQSPA